MKNAFTEIFIYSFKLFSCIITFLVLPLSFIYNLNNLLAMAEPLDIACDLSIAQLILLSLSLTASIVLGVLSLTAYSLLKGRGVKLFYGLINTTAILTIIGYAARYCKFWTIETFKVPRFSLKGLPLILIIPSAIILVVLYNKHAGHGRDNKTLDKLFKGFIATVIAGLIILFSQAAINIVSDNYPVLEKGKGSNKPETVNQAVNSIGKGLSRNRPNIILVTFDALAAEDMSLYGYHINTTPNIDALAKKSYVFDAMIANSNWTRPSAASIIIGKYPDTHKIFDYGLRKKRTGYNRENLARALKENGYRTAAVISNDLAHPSSNGTFRDFDYLPDTLIKELAMKGPVEKIFSYLPKKLHVSSTFLVLLEDILLPFEPAIVKLMPGRFAAKPDHGAVIEAERAAIAAAMEAKISEEAKLVFKKSLDFMLRADPPFFIWIHILPPHDPYYASGRFKYTLLNEKVFTARLDFEDYLYKTYLPEQQNIVDKIRLRYNENIMYADDEFGKFIKALSSENLYENSVLIVSSDHGESFRKGYVGHTSLDRKDKPKDMSFRNNLYQQFIRIPLLIHMPEQQNSKRIKGNAEHVDLAPTILDLLNINIPGWMEGESLKGAMYDNQITEKPKYSMSFSELSVKEPTPKRAIAVIKGDYKYIFETKTGAGELYNIKKDPYENKNLVDSEQGIAEELRRWLEKRLEKG